jgi:hypothetical protein
MSTWKQIRLVLPFSSNRLRRAPFLFLCFFSGAKACFKLIGLGVRKSGTPALGEITDFKTGPWKRVVTEAVLSEVTFSQAFVSGTRRSVRNLGDL